MQLFEVFVQRTAELLGIRPHSTQPLRRNMVLDGTFVLAFVNLVHGNLQILLRDTLCGILNGGFQLGIVGAHADFNIRVVLVQIILLAACGHNSVHAVGYLAFADGRIGKQRFRVLIQRHDVDNPLKAVQIQPHTRIDIHIDIACRREIQVMSRSRQTDNRQTRHKGKTATDHRAGKRHRLPDRVIPVGYLRECAVLFEHNTAVFLDFHHNALHITAPPFQC